MFDDFSDYSRKIAKKTVWKSAFLLIRHVVKNTLLQTILPTGKG